MGTDHRGALAKIKRFDQLIAYLRDEMGWPISRDSFEDVDDLFYEFTAEELGIDPKTAAKIESIKRLRPLSPTSRGVSSSSNSSRKGCRLWLCAAYSERSR